MSYEHTAPRSSNGANAARPCRSRPDRPDFLGDQIVPPGLRSLWRGGKAGADKVAAKQEGRRVTPDDEAALTSAERELERREAELIAAGPTTVGRGTRAVGGSWARTA